MLLFLLNCYLLACDKNTEYVCDGDLTFRLAGARTCRLPPATSPGMTSRKSLTRTKTRMRAPSPIAARLRRPPPASLAATAAPARVTG